MNDPQGKALRHKAAVLTFSSQAVEWYEAAGDGTPRYARVPVRGTSSAELVRAAEEARSAAGSEERACVIALGLGLCFHRLLTLPEIPGKELQVVFARKSRALVGAETANVLFEAIPMAETEAAPDGGAHERSWLLVAMDESLVRPLSEGLRARGFQVRRVVSSRLASLSFGHARAEDPNEPTIVVAVAPETVTISLVAAGVLHHQESLDGNLLENPSLAAGLVNEIRSCAGFWKKQSRGHQVGQVVVMGLPVERGQLLGLAVASATAGARVTVIPAAGDDPLAGRYTMLEACAFQGRLNPSLSFRMRVRRKRALTLIGACAFAALLGGISYRGIATREVDGLRGEVAALESRTRRLSELEHKNRAVEERLALVESYAERERAVEARGLPLSSLLGPTLAAFRGRATFLELDVRPSEEDGSMRVMLRGTTDPDPAHMLSELAAIERELEGAESLRDVALVLPQNLAVGRTGGEPLEFHVEATLER